MRKYTIFSKIISNAYTIEPPLKVYLLRNDRSITVRSLAIIMHPDTSNFSQDNVYQIRNARNQNNRVTS
jgi:hypothetical protein